MASIPDVGRKRPVAAHVIAEDPLVRVCELTKQQLRNKMLFLGALTHNGRLSRSRVIRLRYLAPEPARASHDLRPQAVFHTPHPCGSPLSAPITSRTIVRATDAEINSAS